MAQPFANVILAGNAALDMQRRVSAHAIFSAVDPPGGVPYSFPAAFYAIVQLYGLKPGKHNAILRAGEGLEIKSDPGPIEAAGDGTALLIVTIQQCTIEKTGMLNIDVVIDDEPVSGSAILSVREPSATPTGEK